MKITENGTEELQTYYSRGTVSAVINELGSFAVFVDPNALVPLPEKFELGYNYPNPFNPLTIIPVAIPFETSLEMRINNILGQEVVSFDLGELTAGKHIYTWQPSREYHISSGVFLIRMKTAHGSSIKKIIYLK